MAPGTGGDSRAQSDDNPRMALAPTISRPRLTAKVLETTGQGVPWAALHQGCVGCDPKARPGGSEA